MDTEDKKLGTPILAQRTHPKTCLYSEINMGDDIIPLYFSAMDHLKSYKSLLDIIPFMWETLAIFKYFSDIILPYDQQMNFHLSSGISHRMKERVWEMIQKRVSMQPA